MRFIAFARKTFVLYDTHKLCYSSITRMYTIKELGLQLDSKLNFPAHMYTTSVPKP